MGTLKAISIIICAMFVVFFTSQVQAAEVAMIVEDINSLSVVHEIPVKNILIDLGHSVTLVDENVIVDYSQYKLIVVAGRPCHEISLKNFVANIPVNDIPTIAIDYYYPVDWGWVDSTISITSTQIHTVDIYNTSHPIVSGLNGTLSIHTISRLEISGVNSETNFNIVAIRPFFNRPIIVAGETGTILLDGQTTKR